MNETKELVEKISVRLSKVRNELLQILWSDFLGAVEKVFNKLTNEQLAEIGHITILYKTKENDDFVYRSRIAGIDCSGEDIIYEEKDIPLGTKEHLKNVFQDFKTKAQDDKYCAAAYFELQKLFNYAGNQSIMLGFYIDKINLDIK